ncbi:MAG TPA: Ig-like domain-containing protein [Kofleriaceae bacterium]|nr:Ig-like domain-containing protein [Kofleriaceae bacterium]
MGSAACTDLESATNLHPEGPPMVEQVRMSERYTDATGGLNTRGPLFAFGTHPTVTSPDQAHAVTSALATRNNLRIIMDELLVGNYLEQIKCRAPVSLDGQYDTVPLGATPDDVAKCAVAKDALKASCVGDHTMCLCQIDGGCGDVMKGEPVGVLDVNQDGAADDTRFMQGAVGIKCGSIDVPIDLDMSYWNPSGNQQVPAMGGFDALGPAIVLVAKPPAACGAACADPTFPTNLTCGLTFAPNVIDKQNNQVCAPPDGDINKNCNPGDVTAFTFKTEPLSILQTSPINPGDTGVSRTSTVDLIFNAPLQPSTLGAVTVTEGSTPYTQFTVSQPNVSLIRLTWTNATGLAANTMYTITVGTGLTDYYGQPIPAPATISFTTGM